MSWMYRLLQRSNDETSITLDTSVTGGLILPMVALVGNATTGTTGTAIKIGTSAAPVALNTAGQRGINAFFSSTATSDTTYGEYIRLDGNGAGAEFIGGRRKVLLGAAAGNAHGGHDTVEVTSTAYVTGLCTGVRGNIVFATDTAVANGTYYGVMAELYPAGATSALPAASNACLCCSVPTGTALDLVANAIAFNGADGSGKMIYTHAPTTLAYAIKIRINGVKAYLGAYTTE